MGTFFIIIIVIIALIAASEQTNESSVPSGGPSVSMNSISYPADIHCEHCGEKVGVMGNVDSSTWDLNCPHCKEIAYKHPKREERKQQIEDLLDW